jgi:predicted TIM-barrel fold metal-dependent hydrolase
MRTRGCVDVHAHAFSRAYVDLLEELGASRDIVAPARMVLPAQGNDDIEERLAVMDASSVACQMLSMSAASPYFDTPASAQRAARFINEEHAALKRRFPARFGFFATLPMPHVDCAHEEIAYAYDTLGADGITFTTSINGTSLADPAFAPVWAELNRRASIVFLHPPGFGCASPIIRESGLSWSVGAPIEDTVCAMQLMHAGFTRRYPRLKIVLPHLGGFLPFVRYRLDRGADRKMPGEDPPSVQMRTFWYDTANGETESLLHAIEAYGADKLLMGTDFPYWTGDSYERAVSYCETAGLSDETVAAIRYSNANQLFGRTLA